MEISVRSPLNVDGILSHGSGGTARPRTSGQNTAPSGEGKRVRNLGDVPEHILAHRSTNPVENPFVAATQVLKTPFLLAQIESAFDAMPSDDRELWIKLGHAAKTLDEDGGDEGKQAWLEWSSKSDKFDLDDAEHVWEGLNPSSTSHEQIFRAAEKYCWDVKVEIERIHSMMGEGEPETSGEAASSDVAVDPVAPGESTHNNGRVQNASSQSLSAVTYGKSLLNTVALMPRRDWKIVKVLLAGYISLIVGPGGVAKSMLQLIAAISVATGRDLLGLGHVRQCNALVINNEDDEVELQRRIAAVVAQFEIDPTELDGRLFCISGYMQPVRFALHVENNVLRSPKLDQIEAFIIEHDIGALFVDPFISTHTAPENDNNAMDQVVSIFKRLAGKLRVAINVAHHTRKIGGDSESHAGDAESGRGASAIKDAARAAVTIARMGKKTAEKLGFSDETRGNYIRMDVGKMNFAAHDIKANWYRIEPVTLANGDTVGVPVPANLGVLFAQGQDGRKKWTAESVAAAVSSLFPTNANEVPWADVKGRFMKEHGVSKSAAGDYITLLSDDSEAPVRTGGYEIWISRTAPRNGWMLHRKGVSDA